MTIGLGDYVVESAALTSRRQRFRDVHATPLQGIVVEEMPESWWKDIPHDVRGGRWQVFDLIHCVAYYVKDGAIKREPHSVKPPRKKVGPSGEDLYEMDRRRVLEARAAHGLAIPIPPFSALPPANQEAWEKASWELAERLLTSPRTSHYPWGPR